MRCFSPLQAYRTDGGEVIFYDRNGRDRPLQLRCGRCIGCRVTRSQDIATRCMHETKSHDSSVFLTLTFDDKKCRVPEGIYHYPFQKFMKRLRKSREHDVYDFGDVMKRPRKDGWPFRRHTIRPEIKMFMCGEYGESFGRPHYHAIVFGVDFDDKVVFKKDPLLYRSAELERLWPYGYSSIGAVTLESAQYVAGYVVTQKTGDAADDHYWKLHPETGELLKVPPEYGVWSKGIGLDFITSYTSDVYTQDVCVVNGQKRKPPKYYDKKRLRFLDAHTDDVLRERELMADACAADSTLDRLAVAETVTRSRMALKRRYLE